MAHGGQSQESAQHMHKRINIVLVAMDHPCAETPGEAGHARGMPNAAPRRSSIGPRHRIEQHVHPLAACPVCKVAPATEYKRDVQTFWSSQARPELENPSRAARCGRIGEDKYVHDLTSQGSFWQRALRCEEHIELRRDLASDIC